MTSIMISNRFIKCVRKVLKFKLSGRMFKNIRSLRVIKSEIRKNNLQIVKKKKKSHSKRGFDNV